MKRTIPILAAVVIAMAGCSGILPRAGMGIGEGTGFVDIAAAAQKRST